MPVSDAVTRAHALIRAGRNGAAERVLRQAADGEGDACADRELGRLLSLRALYRLPQAGVPLGEAEERLARSAESDPATAALLINLYACASDSIRSDYPPDPDDPDPDEEEEEKTALLAHYRVRAAELCERSPAAQSAPATPAGALVALLHEEWDWWENSPDGDGSHLLDGLIAAAERALALDPEDEVAATALAEASEARGDTTGSGARPVATSAGFGFLCLTLLALGDKHGDQFGEVTEQIIAADPVDLLWAAPATTMVANGFDIEPVRLEAYRAGRCVATYEQPDGTDVLDWLRETAPRLDVSGPRLPHGRPVCISSVIHRYGYRSDGTDR